MKTLFLLLLVVRSLTAAPQAEFVFEKADFASCHASTITELEGGQLLVAWFGGSAEGKPDVAIWASRKRAGVWSRPFELAREPGIATYNPVLFLSGRLLWLYYKFGPNPSSWTAARRLSRDGGKTWSAIEHLPAGLYGPIKNKPLVLPNGVILSGTSVESYRSWACWVERSTDNGRSWTRHGPIVPPRNTRVPTAPGSAHLRTTFGVIQPAIVPLPSGRLRMFVRATQNIGRICFADSSDGGLTWTEARPTTLPNPNSGIDAIALDDGRILLAYNHTSEGRSPLNLAVSRNGDDWSMFRTLESEPGEYSYPAIIQSSDANVHITYTWRRQRIRHVELPLALIP